MNMPRADPTQDQAPESVESLRRTGTGSAATTFLVEHIYECTDREPHNSHPTEGVAGPGGKVDGESLVGSRSCPSTDEDNR